MELRSHIAVDRYVLLRRLASGGMANVFLARRSGPGRFCRLLVLKCIHPHLARREEFRNAFLAEARLGGLMRHPNVVAVYDLVEQDGLPCMVQEFVHGRVVSALAQESVQRGRPLSDALSVDLVIQCLRGLGYVHHLSDPISGEPLGVVHRDVSPQNLLVGVDGRARIFDFGIAQSTAVGGRAHGGALAGKYPYLSPEQCRGETVDARSDLFSLGTILYELLTRTRLFKRDSQISTIRAVLEEPIPPPRSRRPDVPEQLERIVLRALERDREARYASAFDMTAELTAWIQGCGEPWGPDAMQEHLVQVLGSELKAEMEDITALSRLPQPHPVPPGLLGEPEDIAAGGSPAVESDASEAAGRLARAATVPTHGVGTRPAARGAAGTPPEPYPRPTTSPSLALLRERRGARRRGSRDSRRALPAGGERGRTRRPEGGPWWASVLAAASVALLIVLLARLLLFALPGAPS